MMKSKWNPFSIGSFVIGSIILTTVGLMSFQSLSFFNKPIRFISYFNQSVQGLGVGSDVKMRGVSVGRVTALHLCYDWNTHQSAIAVVGELHKKPLIDSSGKTIDITNPSTLEALVQDGLRARIDLVGITGMQFMQLDFVDPKKPCMNAPVPHPPYPVIPTIDGGISKFTDNLFTITENLSKVDFVSLSSDLKSLLSTLEEKTEELQLRKISVQITNAARAIEELADFLKEHPSSLIFGRKPASSQKRY